MIGTAIVSTEDSPADASTKEISVTRIIHVRYGIAGSRRLKNSEVAAMRPTAVVIHAVSTIRPKMICPGRPIVDCAASARRLAPSV